MDAIAAKGVGMKIKQTFEFEVNDAIQEQMVGIKLDRDQAEELLAALQEALGYPYPGLTEVPAEFFDSLEDGGWEEPAGEQLTPDEAAARLQAMGQNSPSSSMPAGWRGNSSIGSESRN